MQNSTLKISLAQWSLHRAFSEEELDIKDFAAIAKNDFDINAIELVGSFYQANANDEAFWNEMLGYSKLSGVENLLIMVDDEGDLGNLDEKERKKAVENHYKWVNAASLLDCHSIRVNAFGDGEKQRVKGALVNSINQLCEYAAKVNINILIENHGLYSSDAKYITSIIDKVDFSNIGTLPDFGNWCLTEKWGSTQRNSCEEVYNRYKGVSELIPFAKGLSAKSYDFDDDGNETTIDYEKMMQIVKKIGYEGYIGIEFEGMNLSEPHGIKATKLLLERLWTDMRS